MLFGVLCGFRSGVVPRRTRDPVEDFAVDLLGGERPLMTLGSRYRAPRGGLSQVSVRSAP